MFHNGFSDGNKTLLVGKFPWCKSNMSKAQSKRRKKAKLQKQARKKNRK